MPGTSLSLPLSFPFLFLAALIFALVAAQIHEEAVDIKVIVFALLTLLVPNPNVCSISISISNSFFCFVFKGFLGLLTQSLLAFHDKVLQGN